MIVGTDRDATGAEHQVCIRQGAHERLARRVGVVCNSLDPHELGPERNAPRPEEAAVRLVDLSATQRLRRCPQLVSRDDDDDAGTAMHDDLGDPGRADRCECERHDRGAGGQHLGPAEQVATRVAHVIALAHVALEGHDAVVLVRALDGHYGIGPVRDDPARRDARRCPLRERRRVVAGGSAEGNREGRPHVASAYRIPVHGRAREGRQIERCAHRLGEHPPDDRGSRHDALGRQRAARREQQGAGRIGLEERRRSHGQLPVVVVSVVVAPPVVVDPVVLVVVGAVVVLAGGAGGATYGVLDPGPLEFAGV